MNLTKLYKKFNSDQKYLIKLAWDNRYSVPLTSALFPFADLKAVILALEMFVGGLPQDDVWNLNARRLIDQLMDFWRGGDAKNFQLPKYRKLEKKKRKRK